MSLDTYNRKRDFSHTPEPKGRKLRSKGYSYVIQKHEASHLHYDFRLEIDGVLKSWAIPKGPSLDPNDKRLAVQTEDHPLDYGDFEGVIPAPGYGAGTVMLWDTGNWQPEDDEQLALSKGKLNFELKGKRLKGRWSLIKLRGRKTRGNEWLLVKQDDKFADATTDLTQRYQRSAVSRRAMATIEKEGAVLGKSANKGKKRRSKSTEADVDATLEQLQDKPKKPARTNAAEPAIVAELKKMRGAKRTATAAPTAAQLATLYKTVPSGANWLHEIKYDGYRLLARKQGTLQLLTRNQKDWTTKFPVIAEALQTMPNAVLDGELVHLGGNGVSNFERLQEALSDEATDELIYYVFDVTYYSGYDLTAVPLHQRKQIAKAAVEQIAHAQVRYSDHIEGEGEAVFSHACEHGLEGIISKDANSGYQGKRSPNWRKIKCSQRQEFIIVGYTAPAGSRTGFGALLLGYYQDSSLKYAGKVGTGFNHATLTELHGKLVQLQRKTKPVADAVVDEDAITWVKPQLVCEVEFTQWTSASRLRHPAFLGLRADKPAKQVTREMPVDSAIEAAETPPAEAPTKRSSSPNIPLNLSNPDKVLYPQAGLTKNDLAEYYLAVAEAMLPYVAKRPLSLVRCPQGHTRHCFFQKHPGESFGDAVKTVAIEEKNGVHQYVYVDSAAGLVELVQMGTLEIHAWGCKVDQVEKPDTLVFDLDPDEGVNWQDVKDAAVELREFLADLGLTSFLRTTGGKGLHLVIPIRRRHNWDQAKRFCKTIAEAMAALHPQTYVATMSKAKRKNKIFIDYLRNGRGATSICNYSTRSRNDAPVAVPLHWEQLAQLRSAQVYRVDNINSHLQQSSPPWAQYSSVRQSITRKMLNALGIKEL